MTWRQLGRARLIAKRLGQLEELLAGYRTLQESLERANAPAQSPSVRSKLEMLVTKILATEEKIHALKVELEAAQIKLRIELERENYEEPLQTILILRYVECQTWTQIVQATNLSRQWVYALHKKYAATLALHVKY